MIEHRLTAAEAATRIVGLINSRPATPWPHEIEAIIAGVAPMSAATTSLPNHVMAYRERAQAYFHHSVNVLGPLPDNAPDDHPEWVRNAALSNEVDAAAIPILRGPAETWGDIVGLASIVVQRKATTWTLSVSARWTRAAIPASSRLKRWRWPFCDFTPVPFRN